MIFTRAKKRFIISLIIAGLVLLGITILIWRLTLPKPMYLRDISIYESSTNSMLVVVDPAQLPERKAPDPQLPFSYYPVSTPEGYSHLSSAMITADRYSSSYSDRFFGKKQNIWVYQSYAYDGMEAQTQVFTQLEQVRFGEQEIYLYSHEKWSGAIWLSDDHLLEVEVQGWMDRDDLLAWVVAVDESNPQIPPIKPLEFLPSECLPLETESGSEWFFHGWSVIGNPEPSDVPQQTVFDQLPEGFSESSYNVDGTVESWEYQTKEGNTVTLANCRIGRYSYTSIFSPISNDLEALQNHNLVKEVIVQGKEGRLYVTEDYSELVWLEDDYYVQLTYEGTTTGEQMLSLAESLVQTPLEEEASSAPASE